VRRGDKVCEMTVSPKNGAGEAEAISPTSMAPTDALSLAASEPKAGLFPTGREFKEWQAARSESCMAR